MKRLSILGINRFIISLLIFCPAVFFASGSYMPTPSVRFGMRMSEIYFQDGQDLKVGYSLGQLISLIDVQIGKGEFKKALASCQSLHWDLTLSARDPDVRKPKSKYFSMLLDRIDMLSMTNIPPEQILQYWDLRKKFEQTMFIRPLPNYSIIHPLISIVSNRMKDAATPEVQELYSFLNIAVLYEMTRQDNRTSMELVESKNEAKLCYQAIHDYKKKYSTSKLLPRVLFMEGMNFYDDNDPNDTKYPHDMMAFKELADKYPNHVLGDDAGRIFADLCRDRRQIAAANKYYLRTLAQSSGDQIFSAYEGLCCHDVDSSGRWVPVPPAELKKIADPVFIQWLEIRTLIDNAKLNGEPNMAFASSAEALIQKYPNHPLTPRLIQMLLNSVRSRLCDGYESPHDPACVKIYEKYYQLLFKRFPQSRAAADEYSAYPSSGTGVEQPVKDFLALYDHNVLANHNALFKKLIDYIASLHGNDYSKCLALLRSYRLDAAYYFKTGKDMEFLEKYPDHAKSETVFARIYSKLYRYSPEEAEKIISLTKQYVQPDIEPAGLRRYAVLNYVNLLSQNGKGMESISVLNAFFTAYPEYRKDLDFMAAYLHAMQLSESNKSLILKTSEEVIAMLDASKKKIPNNLPEYPGEMYYWRSNDAFGNWYKIFARAYEDLALYHEKEGQWTEAVRCYQILKYNLDVQFILDFKMPLPELEKFYYQESHNSIASDTVSHRALYRRYLRQGELKKAITLTDNGSDREVLSRIIRLDGEIANESDLGRRERLTYQRATLFYKNPQLTSHIGVCHPSYARFLKDSAEQSVFNDYVLGNSARYSASRGYASIAKSQGKGKIMENALFMQAVTLLRLTDEFGYARGLQMDAKAGIIKQAVHLFKQLYAKYPESYLADDSVYWSGMFEGTMDNSYKILSSKYQNGDVFGVVKKYMKNTGDDSY